MTNIFIDNRIEDLKRVALSLQSELDDPDSKGYPGDETHRTKVQDSIDNINKAMYRLAQAKPGAVNAD